MNTIRIELKQKVRRLPSVCRAQALDMAHHIRANVHRELKYTILDQTDTLCRFRAETRLLGMKQVDEVELKANRDGSVSQHYVAGVNEGLAIHFRFEPAGDSTWIVATAIAPVRGWKRMIKPLLEIALRKLGAQALEEDRADLEEGNYQPGESLRAA
jgi:hypothetical protein